MIQTTMKEYKKDLKDELRTLYEMAVTTEDCIYLLQIAYIHNSIRHLNESRSKVERLINNTHYASETIAELVHFDTSYKVYESLPDRFLRIGENIQKLAEMIDKKISEGILFSDKCCNETIFLMQRLIDMMKPVADTIFVRNKVLANYVQETERGVSRRVLEYATTHEERLIEGLCFPAESPIYLTILDTIKNIAGHAKEITTVLTE